MDKRPLQIKKDNLSERCAFIAFAPWLGMAVPFTYISQLFISMKDVASFVQFLASPYPGLIAMCTAIVVLSAVKEATSGKPAGKASKRPSTLHDCRNPFAIPDILFTICMVMSAVLLIPQISGHSHIAILTAQALGGASVAWMYVRWGTLHCRLEIRQAIGAICLSVALSGLLKIVLATLGSLPATILECAIILIGTSCLFLCQHTTNKTRHDGIIEGTSQHTMHDLWIFPFALAILCGALGLLYNAQYSREDSSPLATNAGFLLESLAALVVYWWVCRKMKSINVVGITTALAVVIASGVFVLSVLGPNAKTVFTLCTNVDHSLLTLFLWIILVDLSTRLRLDPHRVFAIGWMLRSIPFWAMGSIARIAGIELTAETCNSITYAVVVVLALVILGHNVSADKLLDGLRGKARVDKESIEQRCADIARIYGLTPREIDVLIMLGKGRSRPHIAEVLDLSENTVRGYTKNMYKKLGIHDRQSLFMLIERTAPDSGVSKN